MSSAISERLREQTLRYEVSATDPRLLCPGALADLPRPPRRRRRRQRRLRLGRG